MLLLDLFVMEWILETDELRAGWSIWPSEQSGRTRYVSRFKTVRGEKRGTRNVQDIKYSTSISMLRVFLTTLVKAAPNKSQSFS